MAFPSCESQHHVIDPTNPRGALDDGVEHRLHVRRRAADDTEHSARCRLMLQRLAQFRVALLSSLNSRTFSIAITAWSAKVSRSSICFSVKGRTSVRRIMNRPDRNAFAQQRRGKTCPKPYCDRLVLDVRNSSICAASMSWNVYRLPVNQRPSRAVAIRRVSRQFRRAEIQLACGSIRCHDLRVITFDSKDLETSVAFRKAAAAFSATTSNTG